METNRIRYLVAALFIFALAGYEFLTYTSTTSEQSTFNLQPGYAYALMATRNPSDVVTGSFSEASGNAVSFYIQTSAQYASFESQTAFNFLYSVVDVVSGSVSYTFTTQDTYYLLFRHGTGLVNSTETVSFARSYQTHISSRLVLGSIFVAGGVADLVFAFRRRKPQPLGTPIPPSPPPVVECLATFFLHLFRFGIE